LILDDEEGLLEVAVSYLDDLGYKTIASTNAMQALEVLKQHKIDLLFSDVVMPGGMDGYELARAVSKSDYGPKLLLASGFTPKHESGDNDDSMLYTSLSRHLLRKPYNQADLGIAVRRALDDEASNWKYPD